MENRGFTIIELLVVIAIIAVLAGIVLVGVSSYIKRAKEAAIKANMATMLVNSANYFEAHSNYNDFFDDPFFTVPMNEVQSITGVDMLYFYSSGDTKTSFCACSPMMGSQTGPVGTYCIDSTGYKKESPYQGDTCSGRCSYLTGLCSN